MNEMQKNYIKDVQIIKEAILKSQSVVSAQANAQLLSLYYGIGQYVSENSRHNWGKGAIETISDLLHKELPGLRGFSVANLKFMRQFYEVWNNDFNNKSLTAVSDLTEINTNQLLPALKTENELFNLENFLSVGFSHHMIIIRKTNSLEERLFYVNQTALNKWSKETLTDKIEENLYQSKGKFPNNFINTIPSKKNAMRAIEMFKDNYLLDFINVEEIGERDKKDIDERVVEQQIVHNIKNFIMTFGHDFAFVGNQYHLEVFGEELFPDLLFFNRELNALVVVELKIGEFKTSYLGQLSAYLRILDDKVKKPHENPSIGIVLCKTMNKQFAEYVIQDYKKPMGVATYKTLEDMPEKLRKALPDIKEMQKLLGESEKENAK